MAPNTSNVASCGLVHGSDTMLLSGTVALQNACNAKAATGIATVRKAAARGVGLTPRLFEALVNDSSATIDAQPSAYVQAIGQHVQSVAPSKQVMAQYWCPVVVEDAEGARSVLHADPLAVRKFRRNVTQELEQTQERRKQMLRRIQDIRQGFPKLRSREIAARLRRDIANAEARQGEPLTRSLPTPLHRLHILVEATPYTTQLALVCRHLEKELPAHFSEMGVQQVALVALGSGVGSAKTSALPAPLQHVDECGGIGFEEIKEWLTQLADISSRTQGVAASAVTPGAAEWHLAEALQLAATADALGSGKVAVLLVASSAPSDLEESIQVARRSGAHLQVAGVFGVCPEDPEVALQQLVDASTPGSSLHLFFGPDYWNLFAAACRLQLQKLEQNEGEDLTASVEGGDDDDEVVSSKILELRLIERVLRECYASEQMCEEEIRCAGRVLERTAVHPEEVVSAMRPGNSLIKTNDGITLT